MPKAKNLFTKEQERQKRFVCLEEAVLEEQMRGTVEPALHAVRQEGWLAVQGGKLYYELYPQKQAAITILICHGFCESSEKYWEFIYYLYRAGCQVAIWDQRGHGKSFREAPDPDVVHVTAFADYIEDMHLLVRKVVKPFAGGGRLCLYAHSMGGCVGARYLEAYPLDFEKAVLNAPMLAIWTGCCPLPVAKALCDIMKLLGKGKNRLFTQGAFCPDEPFRESCADSEARHRDYREKRRRTAAYHTSSASYAWGSAAIEAGYQAVRRKNAARVSIPVLLCQAGKDGQVRASAQRKYIKRVRKGSLCRYPESRHEIYRADNAVLKPYMENILEFYGIS